MPRRYWQETRENMLKGVKEEQILPGHTGHPARMDLNQTQEAFLEPIWKSRDRQLMPGRDNRDRLIRIHISKTKEEIHGYPLPE